MKRLFAALALGAVLLSTGGAFAQSAPADTSAESSLLMVRVFAADMARTDRFYVDAFGMRVAREVNDHEHALVFTSGQPPGILVLQKTPQSPAITSSFVIRVSDIDAVMSRVVAAGGAITRPPPTAASGAGVRSGFVTDPDGTLIEVTQYVTRR